MRARWLAAFCLLFLCLAFAWGHSSAQTGETQPGEVHYYPQSGHSVHGEFLETYLSVPNRERIFGYPITEAYIEGSQGRTVQYFERARFELRREAPEELRVFISPLGEYMNQGRLPQPLPFYAPGCLSFAETEFLVCYAFRDFFEAHGGTAIFGFPRSNFEILDHRIVQYFQRARFEWYPELPPGQRVVLAPLGRIYFNYIAEDPALLLPSPPRSVVNNLPQTVLELRTRAFPQRATLPHQGEQTLFIVVQDQNLLPVANAEVSLVMRLPSGQEDRIIVPGFTDKNGILRYTFQFADQPLGVAQIQVHASFLSLQARTLTSFRIWY